MRVMFDVTNPLEREHTMTKRQDESEAGEVKALLTADGDFLRSVVQSAVQAALEAEMTEALSAERRR
jgi:transposase-like protein